MLDDDNIAESSRLLPLNSDFSDDGVMKPQPKLPVTPLDHSTGRVKRKIRLKRRDRNCRLNNSGIAIPYNDRSSDSPFSCSCRPTNRRVTRTSHATCSATFVFFVVIVASSLLALCYFAVNLQGQISMVSMHLEAVIEEKEAYSDENHRLQSQFEELSANFSTLKGSMKTFVDDFTQLFNQVETMNSSLNNILVNFQAYPQLVSLPTTVLQVQTELAGLGAKMADLDVQLNSTQKDFKNRLEDIDKTLNGLKSNKTTTPGTKALPKLMTRASESNFQEVIQNQTKQLEYRIQNLESTYQDLSTKTTSQMQEQLQRINSNQELLNQLQDNIQNVSSKAYSSEALCLENTSKIDQLEKNFDQTLTKSQVLNDGEKSP